MAMVATVTLGGESMHVRGQFPRVGDTAPSFTLVDREFKDRTLADWRGRCKILVIVPSLDTALCQSSARRFDAEAAAQPGVAVLLISADLPFAQKRFCEAADLRRVVTLSTMRGECFRDDYGVRLVEPPLGGLCARAVLVLDGQDRVAHAELVAELEDEPDYAAALAAARVA